MHEVIRSSGIWLDKANKSKLYQQFVRGMAVRRFTLGEVAGWIDLDVCRAHKSKVFSTPCIMDEYRGDNPQPRTIDHTAVSFDVRKICTAANIYDRTCVADAVLDAIPFYACQHIRFMYK